MSLNAVFCVANTQLQAKSILLGLGEGGFTESEVSVLFSMGHPKDIRKAESRRMPETVPGWGTVFIPGTGLISAMGPLLAVIAAAASDTRHASLQEIFEGLGVPEAEAALYQREIRAGRYLICVYAVNERQERLILRTLGDEGAVYIFERREAAA